MPAVYPHLSDFVPVSRFVSGGAVLQKSRAARCVNTDTALNINAYTERQMSLIPNTPGICPAQYQDPLIANARLVNLAAEIERNLAARKAMRPARSAAALKGWETRNDR